MEFANLPARRRDRGGEEAEPNSDQSSALDDARDVSRDAAMSPNDGENLDATSRASSGETPRARDANARDDATRGKDTLSGRGSTARGRWRAVTARARAWATAVGPAVAARVGRAIARAKREFREQFPSDEEWARAIDEAREVAAYEEATRARRAVGETAETREGVDSCVDLASVVEKVSVRVEDVETEETGAGRDAVDVGQDDDDDDDDDDRAVGKRAKGDDELEVDAPSTPPRDEVSSSRAFESPVRVHAIDADASPESRPETPAGDDDSIASPSFDENDYVFDESEDEEEDIACVCVEPSIVVVPEALMRDRGALPDVDAVSFVPPKRAHARTRLTGDVVKAATRREYWRNARRGARASPSRRFVVRASAPSTPSPSPEPKPGAASPRAELDAVAEDVDVVVTGDTPPWSFKRIDRETRELAKTARTLLDWTTGAGDAPPDFLSALTADVDASVAKLALANEWFDVTDAGDIVLALTPSDVAAADKRD